MRSEREKMLSGELYDAAKVDGATSWQSFRHITMPLLSPTTYFLLIFTVIGTFKAFNHIYIMTQGGPAGSTYSVLFYSYSRAFQDFKYGLAASASIIVALISIVFGLINFRLTRGGRADA